MDNRITRVSLDLYEGAQAAVDSARKLGIKVDLRTFDTGMDAQAMQSIIDKNNLSQLQAVIGPVTEPNVRKLSQALSKIQSRFFYQLLNLHCLVHIFSILCRMKLFVKR